MAELTDPASELAEIADLLVKSSGERGAEHLAAKFAVDPWSTSFMRILLCIHERVDLVVDVIRHSRLDQRTKEHAAADLSIFKSAFTGDVLTASWNTAPNGGSERCRVGRTFAFLQDTVRTQVNYPKLSPEEVDELLGLIDRYLDVLSTAHELPFVRQSIRDGLLAYRFQLVHLKWTGAGYALSSFQTIMRVYQESVTLTDAPDNWTSGAIMRGLANIIGSTMDKLKTAKEYTETSVWAYGAASLLLDAPSVLKLASTLPRLVGP